MSHEREREREREKEGRALSRNVRTPRNTTTIVEVSYMTKVTRALVRGQSFATVVLPPVTGSEFFFWVMNMG
jgi:hypothetical protein